MGQITETEIELKVGGITCHIMAEYQKGRADRVYVSILANGHQVVWSNVRHAHGEIVMWDWFSKGFTADWKIAVEVLDKEFMLKLRKEIDKLIK